MTMYIHIVIYEETGDGGTGIRQRLFNAYFLDILNFTI